MTNERAFEIKQAFEQMKKELAKELGIKGGFVMNRKQIENRTATYLVNNGAISYDEEIDEVLKRDVKVQTYDTWTAEEKADSHKRAMERVNYLEKCLAEYGTKQNEARAKRNEIAKSEAFKKFEDTIGNTACIRVETDPEGFWRLRFYY